MTDTNADLAATVVVVGDGVAGSALARHVQRRGLDVLLIGDDRPWTHTYGVWADEWARADDPAGTSGIEPFAARFADIAVWTDRSHTIGRTYAVLDNEAVRSVFRAGVSHRQGRVGHVTSRLGGRDRDLLVAMDDGTTISARVVVDAGGWPASFASASLGGREPAWQTAFGVVLPAPPAGDLGRPTLMDFRPARASDRSPSTFAYALPVADGWLVEETVLAARPAVEPVALLDRLAARLGRHPDAVLGDAVRTETVQIPMGGARPRRSQPVVAFGAAAGYVNPATGYSVARSVLAAPRVAAAIDRAVGAVGHGDAVDPSGVWDAVWPRSERRARVLHDYGLERLVAMEPAAVREFFGTFFDLPAESWRGYLAADATGSSVARSMTAVFSAASGPMRRRLAWSNPAGLLRAVHPR